MLEHDEEKRNDAIDLIVDSMKEKIEVLNPDTGKMEQQLVFNPKVAWYSSRIVNQPFGRYALQLEQFEALAKQAFYSMCYDRAVEIAKGILIIVDAHRRSIDAKSSEIFKDNDNNQSNLLHLLTKNKVEKQFTIDADKKGSSFLSGLMGDKE